MYKKLLTIAGVAAVALLGFSLTRGDSSSLSPNNNPAPAESAPTTNSADKNVITYSESGFAPSPLTIKKGETVTFRNASSRNMWPATAMHPAHRGYSGTSLDEHCPDTANVTFDSCKGFLRDESWSFTFEKVGTWPYHDHLNGGFYGKVIVE